MIIKTIIKIITALLALSVSWKYIKPLIIAVWKGFTDMVFKQNTSA